MSLNFAMFREVFERGAEIGAGPIARLWRQALLLASRNWQLESLYRSNAKYQPEWQPRFICFEYASDLPRVGTAAGSAEGFLTRPPMLAAATAGGRSDRRPRTGRATEYAAAVARADPAGARPRRRGAVGGPAARADAGPPATSSTGCASPGIDPYPVGYPRTPHARRRSAREAGDLPPDTATGTHGRRSPAGCCCKRDSGRLGFATLRDGSGDLQVMVGRGRVGADDARRSGGTTSTSATTSASPARWSPPTGRAVGAAPSRWQLTSKSLRPLPDKHKGLTDPEARVRPATST